MRSVCNLLYLRYFFFLLILLPPRSTLFPYTTLFRSREKDISLEDRICLLRMNIEGAEFDVLQDLVESGLATNVDGYYGMWVDVSKINVKRDAEFREFLSTNGISSMTFNGRDVRWRFRMKCIEYDMNTSVMVGSRRLERRINAPTPIT